jgi:hypothetical protein
MSALLHTLQTKAEPENTNTAERKAKNNQMKQQRASKRAREPAASQRL